MKNIEKQKQEIKKDNLENNANDLEKRVKKIEREIASALKKTYQLLFLLAIVHILLLLV